MNHNHISQKITVFHGRSAPEEGTLVGYGAIIEKYKLNVPLPETLTMISYKNRQYIESHWRVLTPRHVPEDTLYKHLVFALKYEGINLLVLKKLYQSIPKPEAVKLFQEELTGKYSRRLWFLYEWLLDKNLSLPDLNQGNYVELVDEKLQYGISPGVKSARHRITNNLPGTFEFCPMISVSTRLEEFINSKLSQKNNSYLQGIRKELIQRTSAFLLLKDSRASFTIEGESPKSKRAMRWGQAIGQAGMKELSHNELYRLQQIVIENSRFLELGYRSKGGFVGEHERETGQPIPDHISAKPEDLPVLMDGFLATNNLLMKNQIDPVIAATIIAFGFIYIHPFEDGNGRIHRYLIHHALAKKKFTSQGIIFPVSASILDHINDYREVLESVSLPLLNFIEWRETKDHNLEVLNDTVDLYRYFDATKHAEFLYQCVQDTIENIIPQEVVYLKKYDAFKQYLDEEFEMPDKTVALLVRFLEQNNGSLSGRARQKEFTVLSGNDAQKIEETFDKIFND
ncbi:MAG: Fic family protein [Candidatus Cyclobacteriaceae bacterium M2_1C_046]